MSLNAKTISSGIFTDEFVIRFMNIMRGHVETNINDLEDLVRKRGSHDRDYLAGLKSIESWSLDIINKEIDDLMSCCIELDALYTYSLQKVSYIFQENFPAKEFSNEISHFIIFYQGFMTSVVKQLQTQSMRFSQMSVTDKKIMFEDTFRDQLWDAALKNIRLVCTTRKVAPLVENLTTGQSVQSVQSNPNTSSLVNTKKPISKSVSIVEGTQKKSMLSATPKDKVPSHNNDGSDIRSRPNPPSIPPPQPKQVSALMSQGYDPRDER